MIFTDDLFYNPLKNSFLIINKMVLNRNNIAELLPVLPAFFYDNYKMSNKNVCNFLLIILKYSYTHYQSY